MTSVYRPGTEVEWADQPVCSVPWRAGARCLLGMAGPAGVGKSSAAQLLAGTAGWVVVSFAEPLRDLVRALRPEWDSWYLGPGKDAPPADGLLTPRAMLRIIGDWAKAFQPEVFVQAAQMEVLRHWEDGRAVVIDDVRFEAEAAMIRALGGRVCHVSRQDVVFRRDHQSEMGVEPGQGDLHLHNWGGMTSLHHELQHILAMMGGDGGRVDVSSR